MPLLARARDSGRPAQAQACQGAASSSSKAQTAGPCWRCSAPAPSSLRRASNTRPQAPSAASWLNKVADGVRLKATKGGTALASSRAITQSGPIGAASVAAWGVEWADDMGPNHHMSRCSAPG